MRLGTAHNHLHFSELSMLNPCDWWGRRMARPGPRARSRHDRWHGLSTDLRAHVCGFVATPRQLAMLQRVSASWCVAARSAKLLQDGDLRLDAPVRSYAGWLRQTRRAFPWVFVDTLSITCATWEEHLAAQSDAVHRDVVYLVCQLRAPSCVYVAALPFAQVLSRLPCGRLTRVHVDEAEFFASVMTLLGAPESVDDVTGIAQWLQWASGHGTASLPNLREVVVRSSREWRSPGTLPLVDLGWLSKARGLETLELQAVRLTGMWPHEDLHSVQTVHLVRCQMTRSWLAHLPKSVQTLSLVLPDVLESSGDRHRQMRLPGEVSLSLVDQPRDQRDAAMRLLPCIVVPHLVVTAPIGGGVDHVDNLSLAIACSRASRITVGDVWVDPDSSSGQLRRLMTCMRKEGRRRVFPFYRMRLVVHGALLLQTGAHHALGVLDAVGECLTAAWAERVEIEFGDVGEDPCDDDFSCPWTTVSSAVHDRALLWRELSRGVLAWDTSV